MDNSISFQARIITKQPIKNTKKLGNIRSRFSRKMFYKDENLYITPSQFRNCVSIRVGKKVVEPSSVYATPTDILINDFEKQVMMNDEKVMTNKLISIYKALLLSRKYEGKNSILKKQFDLVATSCKNASRLHNLFSAQGNKDYANRYEIILKSFSERLNNIKNAMDSNTSAYHVQIEKLMKVEPEIAQLL